MNLNSYYGASRRRTDTWNRLKNSILKLYQCEQLGLEYSNSLQLATRDLEILQQLEVYWAFPGRDVMRKLQNALDDQHWRFLARLVTVVARLISTDHYRSYDWTSVWQRVFSLDDSDPNIEELARQESRQRKCPYFEVLVVDSLAVETESQLRNQHLESRRPEDLFIYDIVVVPSFEDAIIALALNYNIQSCVIRYSFPFASSNRLDLLESFLILSGFTKGELMEATDIQRSGLLGRALRAIKPELDLFFLSEATVEEVTANLHRNFTRCFFGSEDYPEMRLTILKGIQQRYKTPFFQALKTYTQQPTGVFHAMPISRGKSISKSHWIRDYGEFYGDRIFLSETSATIGGLDSLLQPTGSLGEAQNLAARAFGSERCLFVSNGTSTANKIVLQAITNPDDIVLIANDSHKSHFYAAILAEVFPVILHPYQISQYSMFGAVSIYNIKRKLLELRDAGQLDRVRALILTNLTFDGIAYDPVRLMSECLALKPDLIFLFDEAWFAYGMFTPLTRRRSAMFAAASLKARFSNPGYRSEYQNWVDQFGDLGTLPLEVSLSTCLLPDPDLVRIRVYATQSTHKTLTALRQASMIHIHDEDYMREVSTPMNDAYHCHTSTSPNYQILASLDIGRRQMQFEGYELIQKAYELAHIFRTSLQETKILSRFFCVLGTSDMIPEIFRTPDHTTNNLKNSTWLQLELDWTHDQFALDPTRITLDISATGMDGRDFQKLLMDRFDIQVNKTSFNTILIIIHIGSTRGMITYLLESLRTIADEIALNISQSSGAHRDHRWQRCAERRGHHPALPVFTAFHLSFTDPASQAISVGNIRAAYYRARVQGSTSYLMPTEDIARSIESGAQYVSALLVTPYPPGCPILLPGQIISAEVIRYIIFVKNYEIHGYDQSLGLLIFTDEGLLLDES